MLGLEDKAVFDVQSFLKGELRTGYGTAALTVFSALTQKQEDLESLDLEILRAVPEEEWSTLSSLESTMGRGFEEIRPAVESLVEKGLLFIEPEEGQVERADLFDRQERVVAMGWPQEAYLFHQRNLAREASLASNARHVPYRQQLENLEADVGAFLEKRGAPPPAEFSVEAEASFPLSRPTRSSPLSEALYKRRSSRFFDRDQSLSLDELRELLRVPFGALGVYELTREFRLFHKSSPSGGGLHPIEAFPILMNVDDLPIGIYHYQCEAHRLDLIRELELSEARALTTRLGQGQEYLGEACVAVALVARLRRNFWKYRGRPNTYNVIMMDAGHLSQCFYLTAADLGLGALYTAALRHRELLECLGLDRDEFAALGFCACGKVLEGVEEIPLRASNQAPRSAD